MKDAFRQIAVALAAAVAASIGAALGEAAFEAIKKRWASEPPKPERKRKARR